MAAFSFNDPQEKVAKSVVNSTNDTKDKQIFSILDYKAIGIPTEIFIIVTGVVQITILLMDAIIIGVKIAEVVEVVIITITAIIKMIKLWFYYFRA